MNVNRVAILIDGAFFLIRFINNNKRSPKISDMQPFIDGIMGKVQRLSGEKEIDKLMRVYFYECRPYGNTVIKPDGTEINFSKEPKFYAASSFQKDLKEFPQMALRLGDVSFNGWKINPKDPKDPIPDFKQKSVDMKIGLDIAWMASKRTVDKIVLVAGDSDFVSPMKIREAGRAFSVPGYYGSRKN